MPTVLRYQGFEVRIYPADHLPPHVHVYKAGATAVFNLGAIPAMREQHRMTRQDLRAVVLLLTANQAFLAAEWRRMND